MILLIRKKGKLKGNVAKEGKTIYIRGGDLKKVLSEAHYLDEVAETLSQIKAIKSCKTEKDSFRHVIDEKATSQESYKYIAGQDLSEK